MKLQRRAILIALIVILLAATLPSVALADCIGEGECGTCTEQAPVCCVANAAGVGQCVRFSDNGSPGAGGGNSTPDEPVSSSPTAPASKVACKNAGRLPTVGWGMPLEDAEANVQQSVVTGDPCPSIVVKAFWLPGWKIQQRVPVK